MADCVYCGKFVDTWNDDVILHDGCVEPATIALAALRAEWSQTPPTVPGFYWRWDGYDVWAIFLYEFKGRLFHQITTDIEEPVEQTGSHWIGPLPVPTPPDGVNDAP